MDTILLVIVIALLFFLLIEVKQLSAIFAKLKKDNISNKVTILELTVKILKDELYKLKIEKNDEP